MNKIVTRCLRGLLLLFLVSGSLVADQGGPSGEGLAWADSEDVDFNWIEIADGTLLDPSVNDTFYAVPLPFTFNFYNNPFDTVYVSNNGYITFNKYSSETFYQNDSLEIGKSPDSLIAVFWDNFDPIGSSGREIYYKTVGNSPFRRFIVEYRNVTLAADGNKRQLTFQVILYESINIFKFQYLKLGDLTALYQGDSATVGVRYSDLSDNLIYSVNADSLYDSLAVLFYPSDDLSASSNVVPDEVIAGTNFQPFAITISDLRLAPGSSLQEMGKADYVRINNPFNNNNMIVTAVYVDSQSYSYQSSLSAPTEPGHATYFSDPNHNLIVQLPAFAVKSTITVGFAVSIPSTPGTYSFSTEISPRLNSVGAATPPAINVTVKAAGVSHYTFSPATNTSMAAGDSISYTLKALDVFGNVVVNSDSVDLTAIGSNTATFSPPSPVSFQNDSVVTFKVSDTQKGQFSIHAENTSDSGITGQSALITVTPAAPDHFTILSDTSSIVVGTSRLLIARLEDQYNNTIDDSDVTFQRISGGDGEFSNGQPSITVTTNNNGNAGATYTASTSTSYGSDSIRVSIGSVTADIVLPLISGPIGYFDLTILDAASDTAGSSIRIQVVARDVYGNPVVNSDSVLMTAIGSSSAQFIPSDTLMFSNDFADTAIVRDTVAGIFSVKAQLVGDPNKQGTSPAIQIFPASLDHLLLRSRAGNKGVSLSDSNITLSSSENFTFYAAGYDQFNNYIDDVDSSLWGSNGTLTHTGTFPVTASSYNFNPASTGAGQIFISIPSSPAIASDTTGIITVTGGTLAYIKIQSDSTANGTEVNNVSFIAGEDTTIYSVGYDVDNNWLGTEPSDWMVNNSILGVFQNGLDTINNVSQVVFRARKVGNGVVNAEAVSDTTIDDQTGLFTVAGGAPDHILIRSEANNGGFVYGASPPISISADSTIKLYAAHFDSFDNYLGDSSVTWGSSGLIGVPTGPAPSIAFSPTQVSSGIIYTSSPTITNDSTNTITVVHGKLAHIRIQNGPTASAQEVGSITMKAGEDTTLYAGGYDNDDNFISLISSNWSLHGDSIGSFSTPNPAMVDTLTGKYVGTAVVQAVDAAGGVIADFTSSITVTQGDPDSLFKIPSTDNQVGIAGQDLPRDIEVQVFDPFGNPIVGGTVRFKALAGGSVNDSTIAHVSTNALGIANVRWTLHSDTTTDSVSAQIPGYATTPDSVVFHATSTPGTAVTMSINSADTLTGMVDTNVSADFEVFVEDSSHNPAPNVTVSFAVTNQPPGAQNASLSIYSQETNSSGLASTRLHLGTKTGEYIVQAFAATNPPSVIFHGIANQTAPPNTIIIAAGNNQADTVGQQLADSIQFKVTDQYGNINSGVSINITALNGSINPSTGTTNANGLFSTAWTLGNTSGIQQLVANLPSFPSVDSVTVMATASPGAANSLALVTMRKLPYDSVAAVPGENITFVVKAFDSLGNAKPNATVRFAKEPGYNAIFESNQLTTEANGLVTNVVKTDASKPKTFFRAYIAGVDTLPLHIFHLQYVLNSLQDSVVSPGDTIAFKLQLRNTSPNSVTLEADSTIFSFGDGSSIFNAGLSSPVTLPMNGTDTLFFNSMVVDSDFTNTTYTPEVTLKGGGADSLLFGSITLPINSLSIFNVRVTLIAATKTKVARGDSFTVTMTVRNDGPVTINVDTSQTKIKIPGLVATINLIPGVTQLPPNSNRNFTYLVTIPPTASTGQYTIDGQFGGTTLDSMTVFDDGADNPLPFSVVNSASLSVQTLSPSVITTGDEFTFTANVKNSGELGVILDADSTYLTFDTDTIPLLQSYSLPANQTVTLTFDTVTISTPAVSTPYNPTLRFYGNENEAVFSATDTLSQTILVQNPPDVQVAYIDVIPDTVSQNQDSILARVVLQNANSLNAPARISVPDSISLNTTQRSGIHPVNLGPFPISLAAGEISDTLDFTYSLSQTYPAGVDTARVSYSFKDQNSQTNYKVSPPAFDTYLVLSRARLTLSNYSLSADTVIQGQSGIQLKFTVQNTGQAPDSIGRSDLSVQFNNPDTLTLTSPMVFPIVLASGDSQQFNYDVKIALNSGTGKDFLDLFVSHTDTISGKHYDEDVHYENIDTIFVEPHATTASQLRAISVNTNFDSVSIGSDSVLVSAKIKNTGQNSVLVDSLNLTFTGGGAYQFNDIVFASPPLLKASRDTVIDLYVRVLSSSTPGVAVINLNVFGEGALSGIPVKDFGADTAATWRLVTPAQLSFLSITPDSMSNGQNVSFSVQVHDSGQANVHYNSAQTYLNFGGNPILVNQSGTIFGNSTKTLNFNPTTISLPPGNLSDSLFIENFTENGFTKSDTLSPVNIVVYDSAAVNIQNVSLTQDTVSQDMNLDLSVTLVNSGPSNAPAIIDSISIPEFGYSKAIDSVLTANSLRTFSLNPSIDTTFSGNVPFNIDVYWHDRFIGGQNIASLQQSVLVLNKADIQITNIAHDTLVSRGQSNIPVDVTISNTGEVPANIQTVNFTHLGFYTITNPSLDDIPPDSSIVYNFTFAVAGTSGTGRDSIMINISGKDSLSGKNIQASSAFSWIIESESDVKILSVAPRQSLVSRGQANIPVDVTLENQGGEPTQIDSLFLHFSNGDSNYSGIVAAPSNLILNSDVGDTTLTFNVNVDSITPTGYVTIDASAEGHGLTSGNSIFVSSANVRGFWTVQQRPVITVPSLSINADTVSTGQSNLVLSFQVANNDTGSKPTATAEISEIHLVIDGTESDSSQFTFTPQFTTPINLVSKSKLNLNFLLSVDSSAVSGTYPFQPKVYYIDTNDSTQFNVVGSVSDTLIVQQKGNLIVDDIMVIPDTAHVGQSNVKFFLTAKNTGEGRVQLNGANLKLPAGFIPSLQTLGFPFILPQDSSVDILFYVNVPTITLPQFADTTIFAGGIVQGVDLNSGTFLIDNQDSLDSLIVVNQAEIQFASLSPSGNPLPADTTVQFKVYVKNIGGSIVYLNDSTKLRLRKINPPINTISIYIDPLSNMRILPRDSIQLLFEPTQLIQTGDFQVSLDIKGTANTIPYSQGIPTPEVITVGGNLSVSNLTIIPSLVFPNQDSIKASLSISNSGPTLFIDTDSTSLLFEYASGGILPILATRIDTLTKIPQGQQDSLKWNFRVPVDAHTGLVNVTADLSFNGGTVTPQRTGSFQITSGITIEYLLNTLNPNSVVPGQIASFTSTFRNTGGTSLILNADSSYMRFSDGTRTYRAKVNGNYTIPKDSIPSVISFKTDTLDATFNPGMYDVSFHMDGTLPSGEPFQPYDSTFSNQITVLQEANVVVDSIDILPTTIFPGQNDIEVRYYLSNSGYSPAAVTDANSIFEDDLGSDITNSWTPVYQSPPFPFTIAGQNDTTLTRRFNLSTSIDSNVVRAYAFLDGEYNDIRKPGDSKIFSDSTKFDTVNVIQPSSLRTDSLFLTNVPNAANGTVNWGQDYNLRLILRNSGEDALRDAVIDLYQNGAFIRRDTLSGPIFGNSIDSLTYPPFNAGSSSITRHYRADLISATSVTSGTPVIIDQPNDNIEDVTIQQPSVLTLSAFSDDSTLSVTQQFQVDFDITRTGQSPIGSGLVRIHLPSNYSLAPTIPDSLPISQDTLSGSWAVIVDSVTIGPDDTIKVDYLVQPKDKNIDSTVAVTNNEVTIPVHTDSLGKVKVISITITDPPGAVDNILSTSQTFKLKATFNFVGPVDTSNRQAELVLPPGAGFFADSTIQTLPPNVNSAVWQIRAPDAVQALTKTAGGKGKAERTAESRQGNSRSRLVDLIAGVQGELFNLNVIGRADESNTHSTIADTAIHQVEVQNRAQLEVQSDIVSPPGAIDGILSSSQRFDVKVWVINDGEAQTYDSNIVVLKVPDSFNIQGSLTDSIALFLPTGDSSIVRIYAPDTASSGQVNLKVSIVSAALDTNSNQPAFVSQRVQTIGVNVVNRASLKIDSLTTSQDFLTQNQEFTATANISNTGQASVKNDTVWAAIAFDPNNFELVNADSLKPVRLVGNTGKMVSWQMRTTSTANIGSETLSALIDIYTDSTKDENSDSLVFVEQGSDSHAVEILNLGQVAIDSLLFPTRDTDSLIVSTDQSGIQLRMWANIPPLFDSVTAAITLPAGFSADSLVKPIRPDSTVKWSLTAPSQIRNWSKIKVKLRAVSTINPGIERTDSDSAYIRVVRKASLVISDSIISPPGAIDGILSSSQRFDVKVWVENTGQAQTYDNNIVVLKVPTGFKIPATSPVDSIILSIPTGANFAQTVRINAPDTATGGQVNLRVSIDSAALDENSNLPAFVSQQQQSIGVNVVNRVSLQVDSLTTSQDFLTQNQEFTATANISNTGQAAIKNDTVWVGIQFNSDNFQLDSTETSLKPVRLIGNAGKMVSWDMRTTASADSGSHTLWAFIDIYTDSTKDENTDSLVFVEKDSAFHPVMILNQGQVTIQSLLFPTSGYDSLVVSTDQDSILLEMIADIPQFFSSATAAITLPPSAGFSTDSLVKHFQPGDTVQWFLAAPSQRQNRREIKVKLTAFSAINPQLKQTDSTYAYIRVERKANLLISGSITAPHGAIDDTISYGQTFTYRAVVNNSGEAQVVTPPQGPQGTIEIQLGNMLKIAAGSPVQDFQIGTPVEWQVKADSSMTAKMIQRRINDIHQRNQRLSPNSEILENNLQRQDQQFGRQASEQPPLSKRAVEEGFNNARSARVFDSGNDELDLLYQQLSALTDTSNVTVRIQTIPFDENTGDSAFVSQRNQTTPIYIEEEAYLNLESWQIRQTWSTQQIDTIEALISKPEQLVIQSANVVLPPRFSNLGIQVLGNLYRWRIQTPDSVPQQANSIEVRFVGVDPNSGDTLTIVRDTTITVQQQAQLKLRSNVYSKRVSQNQKFTIRATILNEGEAEISNIGSLELNPGQMLLDSLQDPVITFRHVDTTLSWNLVAPDSNVNTLVTIRFLQRPLDANKFVPVALDPDSSRIVVDVNMIPKRLFVRKLTDQELPNPNPNYVQGSQNVKVLGVGLKNPETIKEDTIYVRQFLISVKDPQNKDQPISDVHNLISRIKVVNYNSLSQFAKPSGEPSLFADVAVDANTDNPIPINFSVFDTVSTGETDKLVILVDIAPNAPNRNFVIGVDNISAFQQISGADFVVDVTDSIGNPINAIQLESSAISIVPSNPDLAFGNYPNPFGLDDKVTKFVFFMDSQGDAQLLIYTLLGELVWKEEANNLPAGLHDGAITWNGYNGVGNLALNGVYLAVLKVNYANGQSKTFKTKVAFIK